MPNVYVDTLRMSWDNVWAKFISFIPNFIVAVVVLIVGWIIAIALAKLIKSVLTSAKIDEVGEKMGLDQLSSRSGVRLTISGALSWLFKWFVLIVVFLAAADILGLDEVSGFLDQVLTYVPKVIAAAAILLVGTMLARFLGKVVRASVQAAGLSSADLIGSLTQWAVTVFAVLATLSQLNIGKTFVDTLFTAFVYMLAIAGGLAFGLGGKDHASKVLDKIEKDIKS